MFVDGDLLLRNLLLRRLRLLDLVGSCWRTGLGFDIEVEVGVVGWRAVLRDLGSWLLVALLMILEEVDCSPGALLRLAADLVEVEVGRRLLADAVAVVAADMAAAGMDHDEVTAAAVDTAGVAAAMAARLDIDLAATYQPKPVAGDVPYQEVSCSVWSHPM